MDSNAPDKIEEVIRILPPDRQEAAREWITWHRDFKAETDRGAALLAAAYLDIWIQRLLTAAMVDEPPAVAPLFKTRGPLESFSSRISLAFALGLIGPRMNRQLGLIRRVRNDFAHDFATLSFDSPGISDRCLCLEIDFPAEYQGGWSLRDRFEFAVLDAFGWFQSRVRTVKRMQRVWLNSFDLGELSETERAEWIKRIIRVQKGEEKPARSWYSG